MSTAVCSHIDTIRFTEIPDPVVGCKECLKIGSRWVHLRMCTQCGKVGCCDDSPNRHASKHAREVSHPIIKSAEPGEDWSWCSGTAQGVRRMDPVGLDIEEHCAPSATG